MHGRVRKRVFARFTLSVLLLLVIFSASLQASSTPKIIFAGSDNYPPLQWLEEDEPQGFITDIEQAIADVHGMDVQHHLIRWEDALNRVITGQADAVALIATPLREQDFDFTEPFYYVSHGIYMHESATPVGRVDDLEGMRVALVLGSFAALEWPNHDVRATLTFVGDEFACLTAVSNGTVDACIEVVQSSRHLIARNDLPVVQTSPLIWPQGYAFGVRKGDAVTLALLNEGLRQIIIDGTYQKIYNQWLQTLEWHEQSFASYLREYYWLSLALLVTAVLIIAWLVWMCLRVREQKQIIQRELAHKELLQERLVYSLEHDTLTGLHNRREFFKRVNRRIAEQRNEAFTLLMIRITNIETVTVAFSYDVGMQLLQSFALKLDQIDAEEKAHFGSGVFSLLLPKSAVAGVLQMLVWQPEHLPNQDLEAEVVLGLADMVPTSTEDGKVVCLLAEEWVRRALTALSYAQATKAPWLYYHPTLEPDPDDLALLRDFGRNRMKDFVLYFQPQINMETGEFDAVEALLRWQHPTRGLLGPHKFIGLLEDAGLIVEVTRWVIENSVKAAMSPRWQGRLKRISVNITPADLLRPDFVGFVARQLEQLNEVEMCFEITERGFFDDAELARDTLEALNGLGVMCSVDDFGTGHSSLSYLSVFPVQEVKIDRAFISEVFRNPRAKIIVESSIQLAHELNMEVTAEGVECEEVFNYLKQLRCDHIQGFHLARPMPLDEAIDVFFSSQIDDGTK